MTKLEILASYKMSKLAEVESTLSEENKIEILKIAKSVHISIEAEGFIQEVGEAVERHKKRIKPTETQSTKTQPTITQSGKTVRSSISTIKKMNSCLDKIIDDSLIINRIDLELCSLLIQEHISRDKQVESTSIGNPPKELIQDIRRQLDKLDSALKITLKYISNDKGGRPKKDIRNILVRDVADIYKKYILKPPSKTNDGPFEKIIRLCLQDANAYTEDIHKLVLNALKEPKVQKPLL